jgi:Xaa-Pro dipeptidase
VKEVYLTGAMMQAMAAGGVTTPATQDGAWITPKDHSWRRDSGEGRIADGDLVALSAGALADGYVGEVGRTWPVGDVPGAETLFRRSNELWERLIAACRPGGIATDLLSAYEAAGESLPATPVAHGLGLGFDPPVISADLPATCAKERLEPGMVLAVTGYVWEAGVGAVFSRDAVLIGDDEAEVLTSSPTYGAVEATA